jgi:hypothetical protein
MDANEVLELYNCNDIYGFITKVGDISYPGDQVHSIEHVLDAV